MKVLVLGCGSIGTRRAKILVEMGHEVWGKDPKWTELGDGASWRRRIGAGPWTRNDEFDAALICTPPDSGRVGQVREIATQVRGIFVEKPLATSRPFVDILESFSVGVTPVTMGACNLRFSEGIDALRSLACYSDKVGIFRMGQHEDAWSPGHQPISMILDSIHELDLAVWTLGPIESIRGISDLSRASVSLHHTSGNWSSLMLDRLSDPPVRWAEVSASKDTVTMDIDTDPSMYVREMQHFMDCVEAGTPTCNPIVDAAEVCRWALEVA